MNGRTNAAVCKKPVCSQLFKHAGFVKILSRSGTRSVKTMANLNELTADIHESDHIVQFYEQEAFLVEQAVDFIVAHSDS
jgi:hypothetical protein